MSINGESDEMFDLIVYVNLITKPLRKVFAPELVLLINLVHNFFGKLASDFIYYSFFLWAILKAHKDQQDQFQN